MLMTPLILASSAGRLDTVKLLVSVGAEVNSQNTQGHSSLQYAASKGWKDVSYCIPLDSSVIFRVNPFS